MNGDFTQGEMHQGAWLVYLNGLEVPCPSVAFNYGVWAIPEATVSFPPHRLLERLGREDRIEVVVFFLDDLTDPGNAEFKLCYEGEIIGWSYRNTAQGRMMSFNVIADIAVYTQLYFYFVNTVDAIVGMQTPGFGAEHIAQAGAFYPFSIFKKGLLNPVKPTNDKMPADITRPFEILNNMLMTVLSDALPLDQKSTPAVNFFARWMKKRNFVNRFVALPLFEDVDKQGVFPIFQANNAVQALQTMQTDLAATVGESGSFFDVLKTIFGHVYFELAMLPTAPCYRVNVADGTIVGLSTTPPAKGQSLRIMNYFAKPQLLFSVPPMCNVIFPSMSPSFTYSENYVAQPTRLYMNDQFISGIIKADVLVAAQLTFGYPEEVNAVLKRKDGNGGTTAAHITENGKNCLLFPEEFYKGPVVSRGPIPEWFTYLQNKNRNAPSGQIQQPESIIAAETAAALKATGSTLSGLYKQYIECEYYRRRYDKRGGAVDMAFNPFIVPGFPSVLFDNRTSAFDLVGYIMTVQQSFSAEGGGSAGAMSTAANFGNGRTLQEMLELLVQDMNSLSLVLGMAPAEPISVIRDISQDPTQAEAFYSALFHGKTGVNNSRASFDFTKAVGLAKDDGTVEPLYIKSYIAEAEAAAAAAKTSAFIELPSLPTTQNNLVINPEYMILVSTVQPLLAQLTSVMTQAASSSSRDLKQSVLTLASRVMLNEGILLLWQRNIYSTTTKAELKKIIVGDKLIWAEGVVAELTKPENVVKTLNALLAYADTIQYLPAASVSSEQGHTYAITTNIDIRREIVPTPQYAPFFTSYDAAMKFIARPICTLLEYIAFRNGEKSIDDLEASGQVRGANNKFGYCTIGAANSSAVYYSRIYKLLQGPALNAQFTVTPGPAQTGIVPAASAGKLPTVFEGMPAAVNPMVFPQTRNDWDSLLEEYRAEMYDLEIPQR